MSNGVLKGLIEFQGRQHYEPISYFGGEKSLVKTKACDTAKSSYCFKNNIPLLVMPHWMISECDQLISSFLEIIEISQH